MKIRIILFILLFSISVNAGELDKIDFKQKPLYALITGFSYSSVSTEDSCTGTLVATWHMEDLDLANEDGCSILGDTTWTSTNGPIVSTDKSEGTYSGYATKSSGSGYHGLSTTQNFPLSEGTIWLDFKIPTLSSTNIDMLLVYYDASNEIAIAIQGASPNTDIIGYYKGGGNEFGVDSDSNIDVTAGKWWRMKYQWKIAASSADQQIDIWELDSSTPREITGSPSTGGPEDSLTVMTNQPTDLSFLGQF